MQYFPHTHKRTIHPSTHTRTRTSSPPTTTTDIFDRRYDDKVHEMSPMIFNTSSQVRIGQVYWWGWGGGGGAGAAWR